MSEQIAKWLRGFFAWVIDRASEHPLGTVISLLCAFIIILIWVGVRRAATKMSNVAKDPRRMYSSSDRSEGFSRTRGRCEFDGWLFFIRCHRPAAHGDHWLPWSTGGATTMNNFVSACVRCNTSKGAKSPTWGQTMRVALRRQFYFPQGLRRKPGERFAG